MQQKVQWKTKLKKNGWWKKETCLVLVDDHDHDDYHDVIQQCSKMCNLNQKKEKLTREKQCSRNLNKKQQRKKGDKDWEKQTYN
jgi:hypothetical protein